MKSCGLDAPRLEPRWDPPGERFERWRVGQTGFALVDAGMRELAATRWMHNRARMVTASFLVKHLHVDWRLGESHFAELLVDYDPAQNEGSWQWVAGTGIDAQPWFRILNPQRQQERFDPAGEYCPPLGAGRLSRADDRPSYRGRRGQGTLPTRRHVIAGAMSGV